MNDSPSKLDALDCYVPEPIRVWIEQRYYAKVNAQAVLDQAVKDPTLWIDPANHVALFSDHGVVHMRDVMHQILGVLDTINGVLVPHRPPERLEATMKGYGALVACLHDIGMADFSAFGRAMHPEFAAQAVFTAGFDGWIDRVWSANCGQLASTLTHFANSGVLHAPPIVVLRELLALSMCHSKRKVPIERLNDPAALRALMQATITTDLHALYAKDATTTVLPAMARADLQRFYAPADYGQVAFAWLTSAQPAVQQLRDEVLDVLRALRCADALRQRGTVLRTSGTYELFINQQTANLVVALRDKQEHALLLELQGGGIGAGEANLSSSELRRYGHLRISFQRGSFATAFAFEHAVKDAVHVVHDIQADVINSFAQNSATPMMRIQLESTDDNPAFVEAVCQQLKQRAPDVAPRVEIVPSLRHASVLERDRYLVYDDLDWHEDRRMQFLQHIAQAGQKIENIDLVDAFHHTKLAQLQPGDVLIAAGTPSGFVYFPLDEGLWVKPLGGYQPIAVLPWRPLGNTGVIRGADRNADVIAQQVVQVLILPKDVYLRHWYRPFTIDELRARLTAATSEP